MDSWQRNAAHAASAHGLDEPALRNLMPAFLDALAEAPPTELGKLSGRRRELLEAHLATRLRQGFELADIVGEIAMLGPAITAACEACDAELDALSAELHAAAALAAAVFENHLLYDEQADKRLARGLEEIAGDALQSGARSLSARLPEVLRLIAASLEAPLAAIELFDPVTRYRTSAISVGRLKLEVGDHVSAVDASSFVGRVTASEEVVVVPDVAATDLELPDGLRESGIRSCIGVRLRRDGLLGVLYVGFDATREVAARDLHRIEMFAERLALHLENAHLYAALRRHVDELVEERRIRELFVTTLTHDLRSGLQGALMTLHALGDDERDVRPGMLARLDRSLTKTTRMIDDLLDANRLRAGHSIPLVLSDGDLVAIARRVIADLAPRYGDRFVLLGDRTARGRWSVDHVHRAVANLATNAAKYGAPERPITIRVVRDGAEVAVSVHNEGAPIPMEERERIFEPFVRAKTAEDTGQHGWGVGLAFVRHCAVSHGGRVILDSGSAGTTFTLVLPVEPTADAKPT